MKVINKIDMVLDNLEKTLCIILMAGMTLAIIIQIILRLAHIPLSWTEELARYLFIWMTYLGTIHATRHNKHLKVDILQLLFKRKGRFALDMITNIGSLVFYFILAYIMIIVLKLFVAHPQTSASLKINMFYIYAAPFVCAIFSSLRIVENIFKLIVDYKNGAAFMTSAEKEAAQIAIQEKETEA